MPNLIKSSGSTSKRISTKNTNFKIGVSGSDDYGPTSTTGFYAGINPPVSGYTIYVHRLNVGPSIHVANNDTQCIFFLQSFGATGSTISEVLNWSNSRTDLWVQTSNLTSGDLDVTGYTNTANIYYDPGNSSSYVGTGTTLTNIGTDGNATGTSGTLSGVAYESGTANGVFNLDGGTDKITFGQYNFGDDFTVTAWVYPRDEYSINTLISNCGANVSTAGFKFGWNSWNTTNRYILLEAGNGTSGGGANSGAADITHDVWQHLAVVIDRSAQSYKFYKNGVEKGNSGGTVPTNFAINNTNWWIGSIGGNSYYMDANLGEFRVYKSLRTTSEILSEYNGTKSRYGL